MKRRLRVIPNNPYPSSEIAARDTAWSAPSLADFTDQSWADLTESQRRSIAAHYLYAEADPPETFGGLHLPHHRASDGAAVYLGVAAATARLDQAGIPAGELDTAKAHLRAHYAQFSEDPPESLRAARSATIRAGTPGPAEQRVDLPALSFRADVRPDSIDVKARTFDVIWSTGASVKRYGWDGPYLESLSMDPAAVRLTRLNSGAPFLDTHSGWSLSDILGVIEPGTARVADGRGTATIRMSRRAEVASVWQDIQDRIVRNVSVAYDVHKYERTEASDSGPMTLRAIDWEPYEVSAVPMPADIGAQVRSGAPTHPCVIIRAAAIARAPQGSSTMTYCANGHPLDEQGQCPQCSASTELRATAVAVAEPNAADVAQGEERARVQGILRACAAARLPQSYADKFIADGVSLLKAQGDVLDAIRSRAQDADGPRPGPQVRVLGDPLGTVWRGIEGALLHRISPALFQLDDNARQYRTHSLLRTMEECLEQRGIRTRGMSRSQIVTRALHTTSDFASILDNVTNKTLRAAFEAAPQTWQAIARRVEAPDFKPMSRVQLGEAPPLEKVLEHGEFTSGTIGEGKETFRLATYGKWFGLTRQALINDDLDAFGRLIVMFGQSAKNLESDVVWSQIIANAAMADGQNLFSAAHGNLAGSGAAIDIAPLGVGRAAMRKQTGLDGVTYLNIMAKYLIVPPDKETLADQFVSVNLLASQASAVNPFSGRLQVISEPRLEGITLDGAPIAGSATAWYLAASTDQAIDMIEYAYLSGSDGPEVISRSGFEVDGIQVRCRHDFAAKAIEYRGLYKNPGA